MSPEARTNLMYYPRILVTTVGLAAAVGGIVDAKNNGVGDEPGTGRIERIETTLPDAIKYNEGLVSELDTSYEKASRRLGETCLNAARPYLYNGPLAGTARQEVAEGLMTVSGNPCGKDIPSVLVRIKPAFDIAETMPAIKDPLQTEIAQDRLLLETLKREEEQDNSYDVALNSAKITGVLSLLGIGAAWNRGKKFMADPRNLHSRHKSNCGCSIYRNRHEKKRAKKALSSSEYYAD